MINFEDLTAAGGPGTPATVSVNDQYAAQGITFNSPVALDYSKGLPIPDFAHSGTKAIEQCYSEEFCTRPIEMRFDTAQARVKVWVGVDGENFEGTDDFTVLLRAFDAKEEAIDEKTTDFSLGSKPISIHTSLEIALAKANIRRVVIQKLQDGAIRETNGVAVDDVEFQPDPPTPPTAGNVSISGTAEVGQVLDGRYTYADVDGDPEAASTFRWLRGTTPIPGATAKSYALVAADEGALIRFEVTPVAKSGPSPGLAVTSNPLGPVTPKPAPRTPPTASSVFISGTPRVGEVLTGSYVYSDVDVDDEGTSTFRWLRGTVPIDGATARSYALVAADEGALIRFEVTPVAQTGPSPGLAVTSNPVGTRHPHARSADSADGERRVHFGHPPGGRGAQRQLSLLRCRQ